MQRKAGLLLLVLLLAWAVVEPGSAIKTRVRRPLLRHQQQQQQQQAGHSSASAEIPAGHEAWPSTEKDASLLEVQSEVFPHQRTIVTSPPRVVAAGTVSQQQLPPQPPLPQQQQQGRVASAQQPRFVQGATNDAKNTANKVVNSIASGVAGFAGGVASGIAMATNPHAKPGTALGTPVAGRVGFTGAASKLSVNAQCVMCQYYVQRIRADMAMFSPWGGSVFLEEQAHAMKKARASSGFNESALSSSAAAGASNETRWILPEFVEPSLESNAAASQQQGPHDQQHDGSSSAGINYYEPEFVDSLPSDAPRFAMEESSAVHRRRKAQQQQQQHSSTASSSSSSSPFPAREPIPPEEPFGFPRRPPPFPTEQSHLLRQLRRGLSAYKANLEREIRKLSSAEGKAALEEHRRETDRLLESVDTAVALVETEAQASQGQAPTAGATAQGLWPRRYREVDLRLSEPAFARWLNPADPWRLQARYEYQVLIGMVYQSFYRLCSRRMPAPFYSMCQTLLSQYALVAQGLRYGDRPDEICMQLGHCGPDSYIYKAPHTIIRDQV